MKLPSLLLAFTVSLLASVPMQAEVSETLIVNEAVEGTLTSPATTSCGQVLILHGYQDHRDGVGNLQQTLAEELAQVGVRSLRIDFRGEGERNGYRVTSTIDSRIADSEASFRALSENSDLPTGVFGFSLGGLTAMLVASAHPDWFDTMVLWSAAGNGRGNLVSDDPNMNAAIRTALQKGEAEVQSWTRMTITREFILSYLGVNVMDTLANYPGSLLSIRGDRDFLPADEKFWIKQVPNPDASYLTIKGADHIFDVLNPNTNLHDRVIQATVDWYHSRLCQ